MLADTLSPTEIRSFGKLLSSRVFDEIVIQQPLHSEETYSWYDFPIILEKESQMISSRSEKAIDEEPRSPNHDVREDPVTEASSQNDTDKPNERIKKSVRFTPAPQVRIYSIVLGDHPNCDDGLAIEFGWEYCDALSNNDIENDTIIHKENKPSESIQSTTPYSPQSCRRRSYLARKKLLLDVAECTNEELIQRVRETTLSQREQDKIERDNYYYHLAFARRQQ